jgi:metal-dependent amidase/aminoacylase/carboxypeptidase family protein
VKVTPEPFLYEPIRQNRTLEERFRAHLRAAGVEEDPPAARPSLASSDVGNVSQAMPTIHAWIGILPPGEADVPIHTREFRDLAATDHAHRRTRAAACALALTARDVLTDPALLAAAREEFARAGDAAG